jgi:hypothetical protein
MTLRHGRQKKASTDTESNVASEISFPTHHSEIGITVPLHADYQAYTTPGPKLAIIDLS